MAGVFPSNGLAPGVDNSGIPLLRAGPGCETLYYNETCQQRVDARALNALISELVSVLNACPTLIYDCTRSDNLRRALQCLYGLPPCPGEGCYALRCVNGVLSWHPCDTSGGVFAGSQVYNYTGTDQHFTIPAGATRLKISAMGAAGATGAAGNSPVLTSGGPGGYASATFSLDGSVIIDGTALAPSVVLAIMVGQGGSQAPFTETAPATYGFGGDGAGFESSGGGLSGVFIRNSIITNTDFNRAIVVAGGGGGGSNDRHGHGGGSAGSGTMPTFRGRDGSSLGYPFYHVGFGYSHSGSGGGGGYRGGDNITTHSIYGEALGGSSYVHSTGTSVTLASSTYGIYLAPSAPGMGDVGNAAPPGPHSNTMPGQHGRVILEWS